MDEAYTSEMEVLVHSDYGTWEWLKFWEGKF